MRSELHHSLQRKWSEILKKNFNCNFIVQEFENNLLGQTFIFDIYAENPEGKKFIVEIGTISKRKLQKLYEFCQQNPDYTFFYDGYNKLERKNLGLSRNIYERSLKSRIPTLEEIRKIAKVEEEEQHGLTPNQAFLIFAAISIFGAIVVFLGLI